MLKEKGQTVKSAAKDMGIHQELKHIKKGGNHLYAPLGSGYSFIYNYSKEYRQMLERLGFRQSMRGKGKCHDNAPADYSSVS